MNKKTALLAAAVAGLVAGASVVKANLAIADDTADKKAETGCKGEGGCKGEHGCGGKKAKKAKAGKKMAPKAEEKHEEHKAE